MRIIENNNFKNDIIIIESNRSRRTDAAAGLIKPGVGSGIIISRRRRRRSETSLPVSLTVPLQLNNYTVQPPVLFRRANGAHFSTLSVINFVNSVIYIMYIRTYVRITIQLLVSPRKLAYKSLFAVILPGQFNLIPTYNVI